MTDDPNWRNVGNWHWVSANVFPSAREYLQKNLPGRIEFNNNVVNVTVADIEGDCVVNVRKRKLIVVYDLSFVVSWDLKLLEDNDGPKNGIYTGKINVSDLTPDSATLEENKLLNIKCLIDGTWDRQKSKVIQQQIREFVYPYLRQKFSSLSEFIMENERQKVFIDEATKSCDLPKASIETRLATQQQEQSKNQEKKTGSIQMMDIVIPKKLGFATFEKIYEFRCSFLDFQECFTNEMRLQQWSRGPCKTGNGRIELLGKIEGNILKSDDSLQMEWRMNQWTEYSKVTITSMSMDPLKIKIIHSMVPAQEKDSMESLWNMITTKIKQTFGFGNFNY